MHQGFYKISIFQRISFKLFAPACFLCLALSPRAESASLAMEAISVSRVLAQTATAVSKGTIILSPVQITEIGLSWDHSVLFSGPATNGLGEFFLETHDVLNPRDAVRALSVISPQDMGTVYARTSEVVDQTLIDPSLDAGIEGVPNHKEFEDRIGELSDPYLVAKYLLTQIRLVKLDLVRLGVGRLDETTGDLVATTFELDERNETYGAFLMARVDYCARHLSAFDLTAVNEGEAVERLDLTNRALAQLSIRGREEADKIIAFIQRLHKESHARSYER